MNRELRYTLPGVLFALPVVMGYFRVGILDSAPKEMSGIVALLGVALLSFALGYPITLISGLIWSKHILPRPSDELREVLTKKYGKRFCAPDTAGMMVSTLHHRYFNDQLLDFLVRRQNGFHAAVNSISGVVLGTLFFCSWGMIRTLGEIGWRWSVYALPEVLVGALLIILATCQAIMNFQHHHTLIAMVEDIVIDKIQGCGCKKSSYAQSPHAQPTLLAKKYWLILIIILLVLVVGTKLVGGSDP